MGHEGTGVVIATGPDVTPVKKGDRVVLNWAIPCGRCNSCGRNNLHLCEQTGFGSGDGSGQAHAEGTTWNSKPITRSFFLGTMSEYSLVREAAVSKLHRDIAYASAAILGCGVMTGYGSAVNATKFRPVSSAAVIGCGGVGLNVIQGCRIAGATEIVAIDIADHRLETAKEFGTTTVI